MVVIKEESDSWTAEGQDVVVTGNASEQRALHIQYLELQASRLKKKLLLENDALLINENWYGELSTKYRLPFVDPIVLPISQRLVGLNRYILDDRLPTGQKPRGLKPIFTCVSILRRENLERTFIREVCHSARLIVHNQYFEDGNHRTAILMIYELLADVNVVVDCPPMALYIALSNCKEEPEEENFRHLYKLVWKHHHKSSKPITPSRRLEKAIAVKDIQYMNTQVENSFNMIRRQSKMDGRVKLRTLKRTDRSLYNALVGLKDTQYWS